MSPHAPGLDDPGEPPEPDETYDVGVIGLGPAGVTAACELVRLGYSVVAIEKDRVGGLIHYARAVDNFPGIPPSSPASTVVDMIWQHLGGFPPKVVNAEVTGIYHTGVGFGISFGDSSVLVKSIILATGTNPDRMDVPGEDLPWVHHIWTDVDVHEDALVAVIGGGDVAADQALSLNENGKQILLMLRSGEPRCNMVLKSEMEVAEDFVIATGLTILRFEERGGRNVVYSDGEMEHKMVVDAVLISIGRSPSLPTLNDQPMSLNKAIYLASEGLFVAGDIVAERR
ncbi:MAG: NAD(P)/FAD-dependent oxidoreductase, partial [Thermoplasmata archaeon]|nr:NAD(P)/FAD-dependent oxidoreductase [Thermoplasmata archaeon]